MASGNVIQFPNIGFGSGPGAGSFGRVFGTSAADSAATPGTEPPAAGAATPEAPTQDVIHARLSKSLQLAQRATVTLVQGAVPGTIDQALFNQYGVLQQRLGQIADRASSTLSYEELLAVGRDLEAVEKQVDDYVTAVNTALQASPPMQTAPAAAIARRSNMSPEQKQLLLYAGSGLAVLGLGYYFIGRKKVRKKRLGAIKQFFERPEPK